MTLAEGIGVGASLLTLGGGFFTFIITLVMAPIKVIIKQNTEALKENRTMLDKHDSRLDNHQDRIVKIETVHELEGVP